MALTLQCIFKKIPHYTSSLSEGSEEKEKAKDLLRIFSPFLLRGYRALLKADDEASANQKVEDICQWIVANNHLSHENIYIHITEQFQSEDAHPPFLASPVVFSPPIPSDDLDPGVIGLLRQLSGFSIDPLSGRSRIVLHGGQGLQAQLFRFYGRGKEIASWDWDLMILPDDFPGLLDAFFVPPQYKKELVLKAGQYIDPSYSKTVYISSYALNFTFRDSVGDCFRVLTMRYLEWDAKQSVFKIILSFDFIFTHELRESSFLLFESIGYLPVLEALPLFESVNKVISVLPDFAAKHRSRLHIWQQLEQKHSGLTGGSELHSRLMSESFDPVAQVSADKKETHHPSIGVVQAKMPELFAQFRDPLELDTQAIRQALRTRLSRSQRGRAKKNQQYQEAKSRLSGEISARMASSSGLEMLALNTGFPEEALANFVKIRDYIHQLWQFQKDMDDSDFINYFNIYCNSDCRECKQLKVKFHCYLYNQQVTAYGYLNKMFQAIKSNPYVSADPYLLNLAAMTKALAIELNIGAGEQKKKLSGMGSLLCGGMKSRLEDLDDPFDQLTELYDFLHSSFIDLEASATYQGDNPGLVFRRELFLWYNHLRYINSWISYQGLAEAERRRPHSSFNFSVLQLQVFGAVLNDISGLSVFLPHTLSESSAYLESAQEDPRFLRGKTQFNNSLARVLSSLSWKKVYDPQYDLTSEKAKELLQVMESFGLHDGTSSLAINKLRTFYLAIEAERKKQVSAAQRKAERNAKRLTDKEDELNKARENWIKNQKADSIQQPHIEHKEEYKQFVSLRASPPLPLAKWEINLKKARSKAASSNFTAASKSYNRALIGAPDYIRSVIYVELADISLKAVRMQMEEIEGAQKSVHYFHGMYTEMLDPRYGTQVHGNYVSLEELVKTGKVFTERWPYIAGKLTSILKDQQQAYFALQGRPDQEDPSVEFNIELLTRTIEYLDEFHQQILDSRRLLRETFELRKIWLLNLRRTTGAIKSAREDIPALIETISQHQKEHQKLYEESMSLLQKSGRKDHNKKTETIFPLEASSYQSFTVPGDGNCFFSAIAIAMNQLHRTQNWSSQAIRQKIHDMLKLVLEFIDSQSESALLVPDIETLLGLSFEALTQIVTDEVLLTGSAASGCAAGILQQYGEVNFSLLFVLAEPLTLGVQLQADAPIQSYNYSLWLSLAPLLLSTLVQQGAVNIDHWPASSLLQHHLLQGPIIPPEVQEEMEQQPPTAILVHSGSTDSLNQHFTVQVLTESPLVDEETIISSERVMSFSMLYILQMALAYSQQSDH